MTKRQGKRNRKFLGSRAHGKGNAKNARGKGGKGGWGRAGMHKHRFSYVTVHERTWMKKGGHYGFSNPNRLEVPTINIWEIDQMARSGDLKKEGANFAFNFEGKVLGTGPIHTPIAVKAWAASESAIERIKKVGGSFTATKEPKVKKVKGEAKAPAPKVEAKKAPAPAKKQ